MARTAGLRGTELLSGFVKGREIGSGYVPDSERACVNNSEQAGGGTRKLRKGQKDEEAYFHHSTMKAVSWSAEVTGNRQHEASLTPIPGNL